MHEAIYQGRHGTGSRNGFREESDSSNSWTDVGYGYKIWQSVKQEPASVTYFNRVQTGPSVGLRLIYGWIIGASIGRELASVSQGHQLIMQQLIKETGAGIDLVWITGPSNGLVNNI